MTRKEMVQKLTEFYVSNKSMLEIGYADRFLMDGVLGYLEGLGMKPPGREYKGEVVFRWEPEPKKRK